MKFTRQGEIIYYFQTAYELALLYKKCPCNDSLDKQRRYYISTCSRDALNLKPNVRKKVNGLNKKLAKVIELGFLVLKEDEIDMLDEATRKLFWKNYRRNQNAVRAVNDVMRPTQWGVRIY